MRDDFYDALMKFYFFQSLINIVDFQTFLLLYNNVSDRSDPISVYDDGDNMTVNVICDKTCTETSDIMMKIGRT